MKPLLIRFGGLLAVLFGATISLYLPEALIFGLVGILFLIFGIQSLRAEDEEDEETIAIAGIHYLLPVLVYKVSQCFLLLCLL